MSNFPKTGRHQRSLPALSEISHVPFFTRVFFANTSSGGLCIILVRHLSNPRRGHINGNGRLSEQTCVLLWAHLAPGPGRGKEVDWLKGVVPVLQIGSLTGQAGPRGNILWQSTAGARWWLCCAAIFCWWSWWGVKVSPHGL